MFASGRPSGYYTPVQLLIVSNVMIL